MNGIQIETLLQLIDSNVKMTAQETVKYIRLNQEEIARELINNGYATVKTSAGDLRLSLEDLKAAATV